MTQAYIVMAGVTLLGIILTLFGIAFLDWSPILSMVDFWTDDLTEYIGELPAVTLWFLEDWGLLTGLEIIINAWLMVLSIRVLRMAIARGG